MAKGIKNKKILIVCTTDSMIWNFLIPHINWLLEKGFSVECACSRTGFYFDELTQQYNMILHEIPFERNPFKFSNIAAYKALKDLIKNNNFGLIHCHEPVGGAMGRLAGKRNKKYVLYIAHGFHFFKGAPIKHWLLYYVFEYVLAFLTDCIITICREDFENSKKLHAKKHYYIPGIGVDFEKYDFSDREAIRNEIRKELHLSTDDIVLISVGELSIRKNHIAIIHALSEIEDDRVKLVICGEGDEYKTLITTVNEYNLNDRVLFLGFRRDVPRILCAGDIFVFPSLWEGLGLAGIEAMYSGLPVIGSNRQGIKDYVIENETGFLFEPGDYSELAIKIRTLVDDEELRRKMANKGRRVCLKYSVENSINELNKIYQKEGILEDQMQ